ncbi:MAG TPA: phosphopantetheine-binding protein, partial [Gammaproteobacteria bacterium]|nr:phosphopantetheine-binding protein [Gammaproteobacteria bacterium]
RADRQFKIRGFRVELGEIESNMIKILGIAQVVVVAEDGIEEGKTLVAYLVFQKNRVVDFQIIYQKMKESLPHYMIPRKIIQLDHIPLTANGKIDKAVLARLPGKDILKMAIHNIPTNHLEATIASIWQQILKITNVDITRNLFDLGAHSLMLAEACALLNAKLEGYNGRTVSALDMLSYPTIRDLAQHIEKGKSNTLKKPVSRGSDQRQAINARTRLKRDRVML